MELGSRKERMVDELSKVGRQTAIKIQDSWRERKTEMVKYRKRNRDVLPYGVGDLGEDPACCGLITREAYLGWRQHEGQLAKRPTVRNCKEEEKEIER